MINSIHLRNWKTHYDSLFEFSKGTNVLVGQMGAGKTSVVDAISYALFGTFPALQAKLSTLDEVVMRKPNEMSEAVIELGFKANDKNYLVKRIVKKGRKANEAYLHEGSRLIAGPKQSDVNERIEGLLGLDYNLFSRAVYCEQNETDYFLKLSPGERKKKLDELFELERYENARSNAVQARNRLKKQAEDKASLLERFEAGLKAVDLDAEEKIARDKESLLSGAKEKAGALEKQLAEARKELAELKARKKAFDSLKQESMELRAELKAVNEGLRGKKPARQAHEIISLAAEAKNSVIKAKADVEELIRLIEATETEKKLAEKDLAKLQARAEAIEAGKKKLEGLKAVDLKELGEKLNASINNSGRLEAKLELSLNSLKVLEKAEADCPTCERELANEKRLELLKAKKIEAEALKKKASEAKAEVSALEKKLAEAKKIDDERKRLALEAKELADICRLAEEKKKLVEKAGVKEWKEKLLLAKKELAEKESLAGSLKEELAVAELSGTKALLEKKSADKDKAIEKNLFDEAGFMEKTRAVARDEEKINSLAALRKGLEESVKEARQHLAEARKSLEATGALRQEIKSLNAASGKLGFFANALEATQAELRQHLIESINMAMDDLWQKLYPYQDYASAKITVNEGAYDLMVKELKGNWVRVEGILSGGERSSAAITIRIAISLVLAKKLSWIILDEPTHNLDSNAVAALALMLKTHLPALIEQVFIITHDKELEKAASSTVYLLNREKDLNQATKPELIIK